MLDNEYSQNLIHSSEASVMGKIQKQHEGMLIKSEEKPDEVVTEIKDFIQSLSEAGSLIENPQNRSQLRNFMRYWAGFINNKTGAFPLTELRPYDNSLLYDAQYINALQAILKEKYSFRNNDLEVSRFLERYPFLVEVLTEAHDNIIMYFPNNPPVYLTVDTDPEGIIEKLVASIATNMDPNEATDALNAFLRNWWFNLPKLAQDKLSFDLE